MLLICRNIWSCRNLTQLLKHSSIETTTTINCVEKLLSKEGKNSQSNKDFLQFGNLELEQKMSGRHRNHHNAGGNFSRGPGGYGGGGGGRDYDHYHRSYPSYDNYAPTERPGIPQYNMGSNITGNDLMQIMNAMVANNFNMNPPPPPARRVFQCGDLRSHHNGMYVELSGRLIKKRVSRFVELRDRTNGACQLVIMEEKYPRVARRIASLPENTLLTIAGVVTRRPQNSCNFSMPTGEIEVEVQEILSSSYPLSTKRPGSKRNYSTMAEQHNCGITSTEYKMSKSENILKYFEYREITCNDLRRDDIGKTVTLVGWIPSTKNSKFMQLKDGYGHTQIVVEDQALQDTCMSAPEQTVLQVTGKVFGRPKANINMKYDTGEVEVLVTGVRVLNPDEPYDGPVRNKDKVQKMSIDDLEEEEGGSEGAAKSANNGDANHENASGSDSATKSVVKAQDKIKVADTNKFASRTHNCGELTVLNVGQKVALCGWLEFQRMGKFLILRDGYGSVQVLITDKVQGLDDFHDDCLPFESIIRVEGTVIPRPNATINPDMATGAIEVEAEHVEVLNLAIRNLPLQMRKYNRAGERLRLTHRYIDLRFSEMQYNLRTRSAVVMRMREYLINYLGFVEVETPTLFRRTPGGAQEFVVPTRKPGHFYSLVQSPQQFKQMLMAGAIDRYFQVARCYRDEATRPDRQPEFTQLDIELSFTTREDIMQLIEELLRYSWPKEYPKIQTPFRRMTYDDAMDLYGTDKPDTRFGLVLNNVSEIVAKNENFKEKYEQFAAYAIVVRAQDVLWNTSARHHYESLSKGFIQGNLFVRKFNQHKDIQDRLNNFLGEQAAKELIKKLVIEENDLLFLAVANKRDAQTIMGRIRIDYNKFLIENKKARKNHENKFVWILDFPLFEFNKETNTYESVHHPFTAPHPEDIKTFAETDPSEWGTLRSQAYDLVLNGQEIGGGSIRIHDRDMQQFVLDEVLKIPHEHLSHLLTALETGCPPHGGIALGLDRLMAIICRARSIRDVIAFPKSLNGRDPLSNAPVPISEEERKLYHLEVIQESNDTNTDHPDEEEDPDLAGTPPSPSLSLSLSRSPSPTFADAEPEQDFSSDPVPTGEVPKTPTLDEKPVIKEEPEEVPVTPSKSKKSPKSSEPKPKSVAAAVAASAENVKKSAKRSKSKHDKQAKQEKS